MGPSTADQENPAKDGQSEETQRDNCYQIETLPTPRYLTRYYLLQPTLCSDKGLCGTLRKAMTKQKSTLIKQHPSKYPRMEWGLPLPDFVMVCNFVRNTPWGNREEKTTIPVYHKIARQMECPSLDVDRLYTILKVMKKNNQSSKSWDQASCS
jgi:hypothetical protein